MIKLQFPNIESLNIGNSMEIGIWKLKIFSAPLDFPPGYLKRDLELFSLINDKDLCELYFNTNMIPLILFSPS